MSPLTLSFVGLLAVIPAFAEDKASEGDLAQLQGTWKAMVGPHKDRPFLLEIKGHSVSVTYTSGGDQVHSVKAELKLDEASTPKAMDWVQLTRDGENASDVEAIYELKGDTLKIRAGRRVEGVPKGFRPTEFRPDQDPGDDAQAVFMRQKAEPAKDRP
jgi:uncharacterized protein (TIGR03067 family)